MGDGAFPAQGCAARRARASCLPFSVLVGVDLFVACSFVGLPSPLLALLPYPVAGRSRRCEVQRSLQLPPEVSRWGAKRIEIHVPSSMLLLSHLFLRGGAEIKDASWRDGFGALGTVLVLSARAGDIRDR